MTKGGEMSSENNKLERKIIEKNRRIHMKGLCSKMLSLIPPHHFKPAKEYLSPLDQLEQAAGYIHQLSARVEELRRKKAQTLISSNLATNDITTKKTSPVSKSDLPVLRLRELGSELEVVLIGGRRRNFILRQVIFILEDEGAEVVSANLSNVENKIFLTLYARVKISRVGVDTSSICGRLQELIFESNL